MHKFLLKYIQTIVNIYLYIIQLVLKYSIDYLIMSRDSVQKILINIKQ